MLQLLNVMHIVLSQTAKEKNLTLLYVGLFVLFLLMMVLDGQISKKYTLNKFFGKVIIFLFVATLIILAILYFFT